MISRDEAFFKVIESTPVMPAEKIELGSAAGRALAEDLTALEDFPVFDNSAVNGYAVKVEDLAGVSKKNAAALRVPDAVYAGDFKNIKLKAGEAVRIMTGARVPEGTEAIVTQEFSRFSRAGEIEIFHAPFAGENIRRKGFDARKGDKILQKGDVLNPYKIALLASQGIAHIKVFKKPYVFVVVTGDELAEPYETNPAHGKIRNANGPGLMAGLKSSGAVAVYKGIAPDNEYELRKILYETLTTADMAVISGGLSAGECGYTRMLLKEMGLEEIFRQAVIGSGSQLLFGLWNGRPVFGLPGNPLSALLCFDEFVRPAIKKMQGVIPQAGGYPMTGFAVNKYPIEKKDTHQYLFCIAKETKEGFRLYIMEQQDRDTLAASAKADAVALVHPGTDRIIPGGKLPFRWIG